jgi:site-specific DNA recombinase
LIKINTDNLKTEIENDKENYSDVNYMINELDNWVGKFDNADSNLKKAMLSRIIDKVYLGKNEINIEVNLMFDCLDGAWHLKIYNKIMAKI